MKRIVHIEDEVDMRYLVSTLLSRHGYEVIEATSGESGLKAIKTHRPDIVLLDLMLPGQSGKQVYAQMKADDELKDIPIVVLSAWEAESAVGISEDMVEGYLRKPYHNRDLLAILERL
jgi:CheY-like chemotaxis protein